MQYIYINNIFLSAKSVIAMCVCVCIYVYNTHSRWSVLMSASYAKNKMLGQNQS